MATTHVEGHAGHDDLDAHKARIKLYCIIAMVLFILTAIEVATFYVPDELKAEENPITVAVLLILMAIKFVIVVAFFMHLKFDKRLLTVVFYSGLALAVAVYIAVLALFRFFGPVSSHMIGQ